MLIIALREGFYKAGTLPARCHNPGALVWAGQPLATKARGLHGYACFESDSAGWAALRADLTKKIMEGRSLHTAWTYLYDH